MGRVTLQGVEVSYRIMSAREMNLKRRVTEVVRGRRPEARIIHALRGIDLTIERGERFGIVGGKRRGEVDAAECDRGRAAADEGIGARRGPRARPARGCPKRG